MTTLPPLHSRPRDPGSRMFLFILLLVLLFWREIMNLTSNLRPQEKEFHTGCEDVATRSAASTPISSSTSTPTKNSTSASSSIPQLSYHQVNIPNLPPLLFTTSSPTRDIIPGSFDPNTTDSASSPKVYWTIFGGRHASLKVQLQYMKQALSAPQAGGVAPVVDAVHIWDFTCKKQGGQDENRDYLFKELLLESPNIAIVSILGGEDHGQPNISALDYNNFPPLSSPC